MVGRFNGSLAADIWSLPQRGKRTKPGVLTPGIIDFVSPREVSAPVLSRIRARGNIDGSKPPRSKSVRNEYDGAASFSPYRADLGYA